MRTNAWQGLLASMAFIGFHQLLDHFSRFFWYLPAGLRFTAFALLPKRLWPWLVAGEWIAREIINWQHGLPLRYSFFSAVPQPFAGLIAVALVYRNRWPIRVGCSPNEVARLAIALLLAAGLGAAANALFVIAAPYPLRGSVAAFTASTFLGDLMGLLAIAPLALAIASSGIRWPRVPTIVELICVLVVPIAGLAILMRLPLPGLLPDYARLAIIGPVIFFAFRHGWRGAAIAISFAGIAIAPWHIDFEAAPDLSAARQVTFALSGIAALLLGAALDAQRADAANLARQNSDLEHANRNLDRLGGELREAARRNLRMEEEQRRRIAAEIHDELGQSLTAVHTRVKLASDRLEAAQLGDVTTSIVDILGAMRRSVHGLMDSLKPPALDAFGLVHALHDGPLRDMVERAGMRYGFRFLGEPALIDALGEDTQIAIWRIVQEAATNAVRHARAQRFVVRLRVGIRGETIWTALDLRDDGVGIDATRDPDRRGEGLQGLRDRLLALDGVLRTRTSTDGTRLHVLLRQGV